MSASYQDARCPMIVSATRYTSPPMPSTVNSGLGSSLAARRSRNGTSSRAERGEAEPDHPDDFSLDSENVAGQQLQRVKHRQEIPLGPNPGRHGRERVGLASELPRIERRQRSEQGDGDVPQQHISEDVVGEERHLPAARSPSLHAAARRKSARSSPVAARRADATPTSSVVMAGRIATCSA